MAALDWYEKAYAVAQGTAPRLAVGSALQLMASDELAPAQQDRVSIRPFGRVIAELDPAPETFTESNRICSKKLRGG